MKEPTELPELEDIIETLRSLPIQDVSPGFSESLRLEAHRKLLRRKRSPISWKETAGRFYSNFLEPALISSLVLFYALWAFGRAAQFLHL